MSYPLEEQEGLEITDEEEFRRKVCGQCRFKEVCENWEFETAHTLYSNEVKSTHEPYKGGKTGKLGVYRCASFEGKE